MNKLPILRLRSELAFAKMMLWLASFGRDVELKPETHLSLADVHFRLAAAYERARKWKLAKRHRIIANRHAVAGPPDPHPPKAAAMAMPVPQPYLMTDARGRIVETDDSGDIA